MEGLNPLALTYHFGQSGTDITEDTLQPPGSNQTGNEVETESLEASFWDSDTQSGRREGGARILEATQQPSRREEGGLADNKRFGKTPQLAEAKIKLPLNSNLVYSRSRS